MKLTHLLYSLMLVMFFTTPLFGQTVQELEEQRRNALKRLETTSKVLTETQKTQKTTLNKLNILNKTIRERTTLINGIDREIRALNHEMNKLTEERRRLESELEEFKSQYARMVREAHINRSVYSKIMFVFSAKSFDQSFRRFRYLQEYTTYQKMQVAQIEQTKKEIEAKTQQLETHKKTQVDIRGQQQQEQSKLATDQKKENLVLNDLKKKEKTLRTELQKQQRIANELNNKIERLIAEEIRKAEEKRLAAEKAKQVTTSDGKTTERPPTKAEEARTKEQTLISGNFAANVGRLPWPVEKGFISGRFGVQQHPVLKHVTTNNKGIYIQTPARSNARAVFEGVVTQRFSVPGSNNGVIIQHGQYRTVYANLTEIHVRVGQKVTAKQNIGRIYTDTDNDNKTELFFQIWKDRTILNPQSWITR